MEVSGAQSEVQAALIKLFMNWELSSAEVMQILMLGDIKSYRLFTGGDTFIFTDDQLMAASYLLNIHAGLRTLFSKPENVYGFVRMNNWNKPFNGQKPIEFICSESDGLRKTCEAINAMVS